MRSLRSATSLIAAISLASAATLGLASTATAADVATYPLEVIPGVTVQSAFPSYVLEVDCDEFEGVGDYGAFALYWVPGSSLEVRFTCEYLTQSNGSLDPGLAADGFPAGVIELGPLADFGDVVTINPNTSAAFFFPEASLPIAYYATLPLDDPSGDLLFTQTLTTPANGVQSVEFDTDADNFCGVYDERVYATLDFTVLENGEYSFRIVGVSPLQSGELIDGEGWIFPPNPWGDYVPIADPYLVIYSDFDPTQPDANQIACNDDTGAVVETTNFGARDIQGRFISPFYSEIIASLAPGQYTLVLTTYDIVGPVNTVPSASKLDSASAAVTPVEYELAGLPAQSATVELWGAEDGLVLGHVAFLADTGANAPISAGLAGGAGLALLLGALGIAIARRRTA